MSLVALALASNLTAACAVNVANDSPWEVDEFYVAPAGSEDFGSNLLNGEVISPGGTTTVITGLEEGTCLIDVHYVGDGGGLDAYDYSHDACESDRFHITE